MLGIVLRYGKSTAPSWCSGSVCSLPLRFSHSPVPGCSHNMELIWISDISDINRIFRIFRKFLIKKFDLVGSCTCLRCRYLPTLQSDRWHGKKLFPSWERSTFRAQRQRGKIAALWERLQQSMDVNGMSTVCPGLTRFAHCFRQLYGSAISWGFFRVPNLVVQGHLRWKFGLCFMSLWLCLKSQNVHCILLHILHAACSTSPEKPTSKTLFACRTQRLWRIFTGPWGAEMWTFLNHTPSMFHKDTMLRGLDWLLRTRDWKRCMHFTCHSLDPPNPRERHLHFSCQKSDAKQACSFINRY